MARPSLWTHRKFIMLARLLGAPYKAAGVLEMVWRQGHECGDPNVGSGEDVEFAVGWDGEAGRCSDALLASGFLDRDDSGSLLIHDMEDHEPEYVKARRRKEQQRRKARQSQTCPVTVTTLSRDCPPTPAPAPVSQKTSAPSDDGDAELILDGSPKKRKPVKRSEAHQVIDEYCRGFKERTGEEAQINWSEDTKHAKAAIDPRGVEKAMKLAYQFGVSPPGWNVDRGTLGFKFFLGAIPGMLGRNVG